MYGAQPSKLSKIVSVSLAEGKILYEKYWDGVPALKALKLKVEEFWISTGKSYLLSVDKRKLFVRSMHSLLNLLFQSAGALAMKYTTIELCKQLDELDLLGDPLLHSQKDNKVFLMIVYHKQNCGFIQ